MASKIDKDALKKNGFWIGLSAFFLLWLIALIVVMVTNQRKKMEDEFQAKKKAIDSEVSKGVKSELTPNPYTKDWVVYGKIFSDHKVDIWKDGWRSQRDLFTWPEGIQPPHHIDRMMTAKPPWNGPADTDEAKQNKEAWDKRRRDEDASMRSKYRSDGYKAQFIGLEGIVYPATFNGGFDAVFPAQKWDEQRRPTHEEVLLAQEDFWVRREMLNMVRMALEGVREMKEVKGDKRLPKRDPKDKKTPVRRRIFRNAYWELDLHFKDGKGTRWVISDESTIKNISADGKTLPLVDLSTGGGLPFAVTQADGSGSIVTWRITGEPVQPNQTRKLKEFNPAGVDLKKPILIHQYLFWEISPVRRIDVLALGTHSHRTVTAGLKASEELKKLDAAPDGGEGAPGEGGAAPGGGSPGEGATPQPGMMPGAGMPGAGGAGAGGAKRDDVTRINGISRRRYMHVTPQTRHLPIAMRLVVDEAHIHDVLSAVSNNRMRVQITQVVTHHIPHMDAPGTGDGSTTGEAAGGGDVVTGGSTKGGPPKGMMAPKLKSGGPGPGMYGGAGMYSEMARKGGIRMGSGGTMQGPQGFRYRMGGMGGFMPMRPPELVGGGAGGEKPREGSPEETTSQFKDTARLVELSIYGVASLYDPFKSAALLGDEKKDEEKKDE
jgi:hypothetical protein